MMLSDLSSDQEATTGMATTGGSSSHGGDITSYALNSPLFLVPAGACTAAAPSPTAAMLPPPQQLEHHPRAAGTKRKRSLPGNPGN
jgi:hypothetical protein